jgi:hypothetical protein
MAGAAHADSVVVDHYGSSDPTTASPAWSLSTLGSSTASGGNDGLPHWEIDTDNGARRIYTYTLTDAHIVDPDGWELTVTLKALDNHYAAPPYNNDVMIEVDDGENRWHFNFIVTGASGAGLYRAPGPTLIKAIPDIDTAYHTYRFVFIRGSTGGLLNPNLNMDDTIDVYVDGVLEANVTRADVLITSSAQTVKFGDTASTSGTSESRWNFLEFKTLGGGLVSHWAGDNTPNDSVGSNHGTLNGDTTYATGKIGDAFSLDGTDDYVNVPSNTSLDVGTDYTKHAWFKADVVSGTHAILLQGDDNVTGGNNYIHVNSSKLKYGVRSGTSPQGTTTLSVGTWYHGVLTYDGGTARMYLNGSLEDADANTINMNADSRVALGAWINPVDHNPHACCYFDGLIDDAALWNDALTPDEVKGLYDVGNDATLAYSASSFDALKQVHDAESGSTTIGSLLWSYAANLSGSAGLSGSDPTYTLVLNDSFGVGSRTGLTSASSAAAGSVFVIE